MLNIVYVHCAKCGGECTIFNLGGREKCPECNGNGQIVICHDPVLRKAKTEALTKSNSWNELKKTPQEWAYDGKDRDVDAVEEIKISGESS